MPGTFRKIGIVGVGLIGGSVAKAVRRAHADARLIGCDDDAVIRAAVDVGIVDQAGTAEDIAACDLIVLASPVSANLAWLDRLASMDTRALITDVGGTKRQMNVMATELGARVSFVGGHPMAGSDRSGFGASDADLFQERRWFIVPTPLSTAAHLSQLHDFIVTLGAKPAVVDADAHDRVMAAVSALPQVTASALMAVVGERVDIDGLRMAGPGLRDTTRLAASAATWMTDGLAHNSREVADAIDALIGELRAIRDQLDTPERSASLFARAQEWRRALIDQSR